jgi:hypothetical protein
VIDLSAGGRSDGSRLQLNRRWCAVCMGFSGQLQCGEGNLLLAFPERPHQWLLYVLEDFYIQKFYILLTESIYMFDRDRRTGWVTQCNLTFWRVRVTVVAIEIQQCILCVFLRYVSLSVV